MMKNIIKHYFTLIDITIGNLNVRQLNFYSGNLLKKEKSFDQLKVSTKEEINLMLSKINQVDYSEYLIFPEANLDNPTFIGLGYFIDKSGIGSCYLILYFQNQKEIFEIEFSEKKIQNYSNGILNSEIIYA